LAVVEVVVLFKSLEAKGVCTAEVVADGLSKVVIGLGSIDGSTDGVGLGKGVGKLAGDGEKLMSFESEFETVFESDV